MTCPRCDQPVLYTDGALDDHLDPNTLEPCTGKAEAKKPAAKKTAAKKAPAKSAKGAKK